LGARGETAACESTSPRIRIGSICNIDLTGGSHARPQEHGVYKWANSFVTTLQSVCENLTEMKTFGIGFGLGFRVVALSPHFRHLDVAELLLLLPSKKSICFLLGEHLVDIHPRTR
jgi:hypothetical protein